MAIAHGGDIFGAADQLNVDWQQVIDFSASINPLGPSPAAREAILASVDRIAHYPSRSGGRLRQRLGMEWNLPPDRILTGNGATELLFDWCRHFGTGHIAAPAFGEFHRAWPSAGLCRVDQPATWPRSGPLVLTHPANPTGHVATVDSIVDYATKRIDPVLVDESFLDFTQDTASVLGHAGGNLFVLRSMTKFWALPGLRVGALVGDVGMIAQNRPPWTLNTLAEEAALASIDDLEHASRTRKFVASEAQWLCAQLEALPGLHVWSPTANYLFIETPRANQLKEFALSHNVLIRDCSGWPGLPMEGIRIAVRRRWENEILVALFREMLCA